MQSIFNIIISSYLKKNNSLYIIRLFWYNPNVNIYESLKSHNFLPHYFTSRDHFINVDQFSDPVSTVVLKILLYV